MEIKAYFNALETVFSDQADAETSVDQEKYMKNQFSFLGLKSKVRNFHQSQFLKQYGYPDDHHLAAFTKLCFRSPYRELHYSALEIIKRRLKYQKASFIHDLEWLVVHKSWWDTVDGLAGLIGEHLQRHPQLQPATTDRYNLSDNMWLNRVAILHQLKYRGQVDFELLKKYILHHIESKEFFIRKAQGWALRQYGKFNPKKVADFVADHPDLSGLTKREALKYV